MYTHTHVYLVTAFRQGFYRGLPEDYLIKDFSCEYDKKERGSS